MTKDLIHYFFQAFLSSVIHQGFKLLLLGQGAEDGNGW